MKSFNEAVSTTKCFIIFFLHEFISMRINWMKEKYCNYSIELTQQIQATALTYSLVYNIARPHTINLLSLSVDTRVHAFVSNFYHPPPSHSTSTASAQIASRWKKKFSSREFKGWREKKLWHKITYLIIFINIFNASMWWCKHYRGGWIMIDGNWVSFEDFHDERKKKRFSRLKKKSWKLF